MAISLGKNDKGPCLASWTTKKEYEEAESWAPKVDLEKVLWSQPSFYAAEGPANEFKKVPICYYPKIVEFAEPVEAFKQFTVYKDGDVVVDAGTVYYDFVQNAFTYKKIGEYPEKQVRFVIDPKSENCFYDFDGEKWVKAFPAVVQVESVSIANGPVEKINYWFIGLYTANPDGTRVLVRDQDGQTLDFGCPGFEDSMDFPIIRAHLDLPEWRSQEHRNKWLNTDHRKGLPGHVQNAIRNLRGEAVFTKRQIWSGFENCLVTIKTGNETLELEYLETLEDKMVSWLYRDGGVTYIEKYHQFFNSRSYLSSLSQKVFSATWLIGPYQKRMQCITGGKPYLKLRNITRTLYGYEICCCHGEIVFSSGNFPHFSNEIMNEFKSGLFSLNNCRFGCGRSAGIKLEHFITKDDKFLSIEKLLEGFILCTYQEWLF